MRKSGPLICRRCKKEMSWDIIHICKEGIDTTTLKKYPTKTEFMKYEKLRQKGTINMCDIKQVEAMTGLSRATLMTIMSNYIELKNAYMTKDDEWLQ